ncbi:MAG TPA: pilus assembly protein TadG-related protein [Candidatus Limnocylindrales bacterium]|nr:pilus assembly protein TadG-related protein [Candidatus Limnocylindrales bacterium]
MFPPRRGAQAGQTLVLVALWLAVLLGFAAIAVDTSRFLAERRFLQNAADAAALAGANKLVAGGTVPEAEAAARAVLTENFGREPTGNPPSQPSAIPIYTAGHAGEPAYLEEGILVTSGEVRVALRNPVNYTFGRIAGLLTADVGARARAGFTGGLMPIAVRRFVNAPGPEAGATAPCPNDQTRFLDFFATQDTACLGSDTDASPRATPGPGASFDPVDPASDPDVHGPVVTILGQGAQPSNGADFRGFIALDIRNFSTSTSQVYYNGITSGTPPNILKNFEAAWVTKGGYPGPAFPPATTPPAADDQVGIIAGNSTGIVIDEVVKRFVPGDEVLVAVYPGQVMAIPDFAITPPGTVALPSSGTVADAGSFKVSRNQAFSGQVTLSTLADTLDPANPMVLGTLVGAQPFTYDPNPVTPSLGGGASVDMENATTSGATPGIYALWVQGQAGSPYLTTKWEPFTLKVGTVTRDFTLTADASSNDALSVGDTVTFNLTLTNAPSKNTNFGNPVNLCLDPPLPAGVGATSLPTSCTGSPTVTPSRNGSSYTLSINTGTMAPGAYRFIVRATGTNADSTPSKVTHLLPLTVNVAPSGASGSDQYIDIVGFAVMRIATVDPNFVEAYAITPVVADMNDPSLRRGQTVRLLPW